MRLSRPLLAVLAVSLTSGIFAAPSSSPYAPYGDWPLNNNGADNSGVVTGEKFITPQNVRSLQPVFQVNLPGDGVNSTPTIADNKVYIATGKGVVAAINGENGKILWQKTLSVENSPLSFDGPPVKDCFETYGPSSPKCRVETFAESPVLTKHKLFIAQDNMFALNRHTGEVLWSVPVYNPYIHPNCKDYDFSGIMAAQLALAGNKVIYTFGFADSAPPLIPNYDCEFGQIIAVNQDTGHIDWRVDTTKVNGVQYGAGTGGVRTSRCG